MKRRKFIFVAGAGTVAVSGLTYFLNDNYQNHKYIDRINDTWRHSIKFDGSNRAIMIELIRYATLAANSHNTQPWFFKIGNNKITISPDFTRRCSAVDPDDHHLYASLGCAAENIVHAARVFSLEANVSIQSDSAEVIQIDFEHTSSSQSELFKVIPKRQCTRAPYEGKKASAQQLKVLEIIAQDTGISTQIFTDTNDLETILEFVVAGNTDQMRDKAFVKELKDWIRFNPHSAMKHGDGLYTATSGNPTSPTFFGSLLFDMVFNEKPENDKYRDQIRSSAGVIALVSEKDDIEHWIKAGRCYQRFALQATAFGLKHSFVNQAVEVPEVRTQLANYLNIGNRRTDLLIRFGVGTDLPKSLRRPVSEVIV
ncbi:Tat pathway signal protein [Flagellimonas aquimarina]|uniref:Tat pathway signal protein n=1 Tax=Flagellimonas aquimarina TaxID=2201895 RepID=A0A316L4I0_9FLAO|nr:Tat pathway signal protein [Allomuricauda koreensis]PWL39829.1 Tat pathway signal protein [Allomuricauda koreensis]